MWKKVGDIMLMGEYHHSIDEKNRLIIPSKFRNDLGEKFVITRGLEKCLFVYSLVEWENIINKLRSLPFTKKDSRDFTRFFLSGATECILDKSGRVCITSPFGDYAGVTKNCVIICANDRLEIWDKEKWDNFFIMNEENFANISENLFEVV